LIEEEVCMPERKTIARAKEDLREGKAPSTAAGEFVKEEIDHVRGGKHGARSAKQAIAIGLSKARRSGIPLAPPKKGSTSTAVRRRAERDEAVGQGERKRRSPSKRRSQATKKALAREPHKSASRGALTRQAKETRPARKKATRSRATPASRAGTRSRTRAK
jgi:hypothetical protein